MIVAPHPSRTLNAIGLLVICGVLIAAYVFQFTLDELPCPLCLLQRVGLVMVGFGLCLNLVYGAKPHHYGIMLIGGLYGLSVSVRQILLHIVPGTGAYGSPVLGLHYYTWAGICFFLVLVGTAIMLLFEGQYKSLVDEPGHEKFGGHRLAKFAFFLMLALTAGNAVSTLLECGPTVCADPPTQYKLIEDLEKSG
ncbi:disulfide bond formation protein B [Hoeflea prorocentri]|uniref:Disulfide bond formation protein B n=1 Tax=Hoeflea prorocentri TaxID=1922333 RepID=A0A9X3ZG63_9HYPH|nr:disulfide bond formation protein B [Hoeflea prorocentri]MCY6380442.1 disulfide bond formation protein B [Hoeflea prorocentri]MDA5398242.1 disulfide bond formation protein B [Hoeflea prorocentri]